MGNVERGARIAGRYVVEERLGEGGMGVVLRARDERLGRAVAVKVLAPGDVGDAAARARLVREARAAAGLEHPGIVHVYDVGETEDGGAFLVMELVRGKSLRDELAVDRLSRGDRLRVLCEVARALAFAHDAGLVHRDVKPDNVMVRDDGRAVVLDFGLAKSAMSGLVVTAAAPTQVTADGSFVGTPAYLAPEQARGELADARADQFALGVTAFEVMTGRLPWTGKTAALVLAEIVRDEPPKASDVAVGIPEALDTAIARALAKEPGDRFASMNAFAYALAEASEQMSVSAIAVTEALPAASAPSTGAPRPLSTSGAAVERVVPAARASSPRRWLLLAALGVAGAAGVGGVASWRSSRPSVAPLSSAAVPLAALDPESTVIACPPLVASGVEEPAGWLGAAAATHACERLQMLLGGATDRTRIPAELLDLPRAPVDDFPVDPYGDPTARDRAVAAAKQRASSWLDGEIAAGAGFHVKLSLRDPAGAELARGEGDGPAMFQAVRAAMDPVAAALHVAAPASPFEHDWMRVDTRDAAVALVDLTVAFVSEDTVAVDGECARVLARGDVAPELLYFLRADCAERLRRPRPEGAAPDSDASSPGAFLSTAIARKLVDPQDARRASAERLHALFDAETRQQPRAMLAAGEASLRGTIGESSRAHEMALLSVHSDPKVVDARAFGWHMIEFTSEALITSPAHAAWVPWEPLAQYSNGERRDLDAQLRFARRAFALGPRGFWPAALVELLLRAGRREEAMGVAARTDDDLLRVEISAGSARFAAALAQAGDLLDKLPSDVEASDRAYNLAFFAQEMAAILGRPADFVDALVRRYVDADPPLLSGRVVPFTHLIFVCATAPLPVARRCTSRLRALLDSGALDALFSFGMVRPLVLGADSFARGDWLAAEKAWRPLLEIKGWLVDQVRDTLAIACDRAGDFTLAESVDQGALVLPGRYHGAEVADVRSALRADKRGDRARARALAQTVVTAWSVADETVPAVAQMKQILAR